MITWMNVVLTFSILKDVLANISITESGGGVKRPGDSLRLTCTCSGFNIDTYWIHWVRQADGKGLEWISQIKKGSTFYDDSFNDRFPISKDSSRNIVYLDMTGLKAEDTAKYYCLQERGHVFDVWGQGTTVTVISGTAQAPTVFPLSPSDQTQVSTDSNVSIGCLVKNYFPEPATVQWNSGAITNGIHHFPPVVHSSGQYTHISLLTIPASQWESEAFHCNINHEATHTRINKNIERCDREPVAPKVHMLHSSCSPKSSVGTIALVCFIENFYPKEITVEWLVGSHQGLLAPYTEPPKRDSNTYTFSTNSVANITQEDWLEGNTYYCQVTHAASQTRTKSRARKCEDAISHFSTAITAYLLPPQPKALYINRNAKIACVVVNLEREEGLKISWSREKQVAVHPELLVVTEENNGTFTAVSRLPVTAQDWESHETFTCSVEYPGLPGPIVKTITKRREKSKGPIIHVYPPIPGNSQILTCFIRGFVPNDIDIQWLKNGQAVPENEYVNTPAVKEKSGDTHFGYSKLTIPDSSWNEGGVFTCMVVHEGLEMKFTEKSIEKTSGKR